MSEEENDIRWWIEEALTELENAMDALHKLNRETDVIDDVEYNKINRAIWDIEQILKERRDR
jgi:hypothetical protein|tara:strand:+ start:163 stop:348 length:186 start_codon:yes stop_codon:yes gene_type:complete